MKKKKQDNFILKQGKKIKRKKYFIYSFFHLNRCRWFLLLLFIMKHLSCRLMPYVHYAIDNFHFCPCRRNLLITMLQQFRSYLSEISTHPSLISALIHELHKFFALTETDSLLTMRSNHRHLYPKRNTITRVHWMAQVCQRLHSYRMGIDSRLILT
jgi:hypothetical protein